MALIFLFYLYIINFKIFLLNIIKESSDSTPDRNNDGLSLKKYEERDKIIIIKI
jgi:hypothetical protein